MKERVILSFLGQSSEEILVYACREFPEQTSVLLIARDDDHLQPPVGVDCIPLSRFQPEIGVSYILIFNGGTGYQLLLVLKRLTESGAKFSAWNLQRNGKTQVW